MTGWCCVGAVCLERFSIIFQNKQTKIKVKVSDFLSVIDANSSVHAVFTVITKAHFSVKKNLLTIGKVIFASDISGC